MEACADCGRPLAPREAVAGAEPVQRRRGPPPVQVARFDDETAAHAALEILKAEQVEADQVESTGRPITYSLYVDHTVEQAARAILELAERRTQDARQFLTLKEDTSPVAWRPSYRSARLRTNLVQVCLILNLTLSLNWIILLILIFLNSDHRDPALRLGGLNQSSLEALEELSPVLDLSLLVLTIVLFLTWLHRINRNTHALEVHDLRFRPARAVGFCVLPLVNLAGPFFVMKELWLANASRQVPENAAGYRARPAPFGLVAWWACTLLWAPLTRIRTVLFRGADTPGELDTALFFALFVELFPIAVFLLTLQMIRKIQRDQLERQRSLAA